MPRTTLVLVRIAVHVPESSLGRPEDCHPMFTTHCGKCGLGEKSQPPFTAPLVTLEMLAFYREHPDNN